MRLEDIKKICIIGAGVMGNQMAEFFSRVGEYEVFLVDLNEDIITQGLKAIEDRLERFFVAKKRINSDEKMSIMERIHGRTSYEEGASNADLIIEAVPEVLRIKQEVFRKLDAIAPKEAVLASNTSSLNITDIAKMTKRESNVIGIHFFNPVGLMKLVEIVTGCHTSNELKSLAVEFCQKLGKEPVVCRDTSFGFLANRAYDALREELLDIVWEKVASPEDADKALKLGYNLPIGPLELGDRLGSWKRRAEMEEDKVAALGPVKGRLHPLIRTMVRAGYYGGAGNKGIYDFWKEVLSKW